MNCKTARHDIALYAGNDLDGLSIRELKSHLLRCPECAAYWKQMQSSIDALKTPSREAALIHDSVWPGISARLSRRPAFRREDRFNGWAPALAVVASCMFMLFVTQRNTTVNEPVGVAPVVSPHSALQPVVGPPGELSVPQLRHFELEDPIESDFQRMLDELGVGHSNSSRTRLQK